MTTVNIKNKTRNLSTLSLAIGCLICVFLFISALKGPHKTEKNKLQFSIPFTLVDNRAFIEVKVNDTILHFVVDCGGINAVDDEIAETIGLKIMGKREIQGAGEKTVEIGNTSVNSLTVGKDNMKNVNFISLGLSEIKQNLKLPFLDGILGFDYFGDKIIQFDFPNKMINIFSHFKGENPIPVTLFNDRIPQVKCTIDNKQLDFLFDTGDRSELTVLKHTAELLNISKHYKLSESLITGYGVGGPVYARVFNLNQLTINNKNYSHISTRIPDAKSGLFAREDIDGSIGNGFLKNHVFTIDYPNKKVYLN